MLNRRGNLNRFVPLGSTRAVWAVDENLEPDREHRWAVWLRAMAHGDLQALSSLYDESSLLLFGLVLRILRDREAAEELLVEIYEHIGREAAGFDGREQNPGDWLINLARNFAVDRLRRNGGSTDAATDIFQHRRQVADSALQRLSDEQRCILEMTYLDGFTAGDVAATLDVSTEYVKAQIVLALRKLRMAGANRMSLRITNFD